MTSQPRKKVIVIGAGVGGCSTAARLAHAGLDVDVYEKNSFSGGRCSLIRHDGYRFDQGPSLLLLRPLFDQLFRELDTNMDDYVKLVQCDPNYVIHYHDGEKVILSSDRAQLAKEVEKYEGPSGPDRLEAFLKEASGHSALSYSMVLSKSFPSFLSYISPAFFQNVIKLHAFGTLYGRCARYFQTERMRRAFSFGSMYLGSSPFESPGTYTLLQWTETCEGIWYPIGGYHKIIEAIVTIAESHGVKFHYDSPVRFVNYDSSGKTTGVTLESGEIREADVVVVNADVVWAHNNLFLREDAPQKRVEKDRRPQDELLNPKLATWLLDKPHSCSSISFYWAMDRKIPALNAHNIFLAEDYRGSFDDIFLRKGMPREPSFYVNVPSRLDPSAAPEGKDAMVILVPVGHLLPNQSSEATIRTFSNGSSVPDTESQNWPALIERARSQIIEILEERLEITDLRGKITWEDVNTPLSWKEKFNLTHGSILGITHDFFNVLAFRQQARHPSVKGAYFVGASTHPGTGVPICIAGSRLTTEAVLTDLSIPYPPSYSQKPAEPQSSLDVKHSRKVRYVIEDIISTMLPFVVGSIVTAVFAYIYLKFTGQLAVSKPPVLLQDKVAARVARVRGLGDLDVKSPAVIGGSTLVLLLSVAYMMMPASNKA